MVHTKVKAQIRQRILIETETKLNKKKLKRK